MEPDVQAGTADQPNPHLESLINMDGETAKQMSDSLLHAAPSASLVNRTPVEMKQQTDTGGLWKTAITAAKRSFGGTVAGFIDPIARGALRGVTEGTKSLAQLDQATGPGPVTALVKGGELLSAGLAHALGDNDYSSIARDGLVTARAADAALGKDENTGFHAFVRDVTQFSTVAAMMPVAGPEAGLGKLAVHLTKNALVDAGGFDPRQERLSNQVAGWLKDAPLGLDKPFKWLATNPSDPIALARTKAALEGMFVGQTIEKLTHGIRSTATSDVVKKAVSTVTDYFGPAKYTGPQFADMVDPPWWTKPAPDPYRVEATGDDQFRVVQNVGSEDGAALPSSMTDKTGTPTFKTQQEAESVAASLGVAERNAARTGDVTDSQASYFRTLARWIHNSGNYAEFQSGVLNVDIGGYVGGVHDINFKYDMSPEQTGHTISALSVIFRDELNKVRIPESLQLDPQGGSSISNAETLAKTARDLNGSTAGSITDKVSHATSVLNEVPSIQLASRVVRQNLAQQVEVLGRAMEASESNSVAHMEFLKATNTLTHSFVAESGLRSAMGRAFQSFQMEVGSSGAALSRTGRKAFKRAMQDSKAEPLEVLHFDLLDEPASQADIAATEEARLKSVDGESQQGPQAPAAVKGEVHGFVPTSVDVPGRPSPVARKTVALNADQKARAVSGKNTFTITDEATHKIDKAVEKLDSDRANAYADGQNASVAAEEDASLAAADAMASKSLPKDHPDLVKQAAENGGVSQEDFQLAKDRLLAMRQTIAEKRAAGGSGVVDWSRYTDSDMKDLASMHVEHVKQLADEQRANPLNPFRKERTVYVTGRQARQMARDIAFTPRDEAERDQTLKALLGMGRKATEAKADAPPSYWDNVVKWRAWSMLSKPTSAAVNFASALSTTLYRPFEGLLGATARTVGNAAIGDMAGARDGINGMARQKNLFVGTLKSYHDAMVEAGKSARLGTTILSSRDGSVPLTGAASWNAPISALVHTTERMMTAGDEFAMQIAYRGNVYAQAMEHARAAGVTDSGEIAKRVDDAITSAFDDAGRGVNPSALLYAQQVTLRNKLEGGVFGSLEQAARDHGIVRVLFPFTRIPANLVRYQMDRAPVLGMFTGRNMDAFRAGGMQRDEAIGRQLGGLATWTLGLTMANAGMITGGGPKDPELRRQWMNVNQPYSVKIGGKWISYRRFEPLSTPLGIMADVHDMLGEMPDDASWGDMATGFMAGVAQNLTSKTYLKTLSDFFYAMGSGKSTAMDSMLDGVAGSFVPNVIQGLNPDDALRSTRGLVDRMKSRIPGLSETLEPRRNIYGEKVMKPSGQFQRMFNPFTISSANADPVDVELLRVGAGISMPSPKKFGVDLRDRTLLGTKQSPYDRWMELLSTNVVPGQPPLRDYLREFVASDTYKNLTDDTNGFTGSRIMAIEKIVRGYRSAAFAKMITENPKVMQAIVQQAGLRGAALSGDPEVAGALAHGNPKYDQLSGQAREAEALLGQ